MSAYENQNIQHDSTDSESVREAIGYDKPYDSQSLTSDQAAALYRQGLGGNVVARSARRTEDVGFFDQNLGQPEGTHDVIKSPEDALSATERWATRNDAVISGLEQQLHDALEQHDTEAAARLRARIERQEKLRNNIGSRIMRLTDTIRTTEESPKE